MKTSFDLIGVSPAIGEVRKAIARAANAPFTVLIEGESGSGKELVARAIHRAGCRRDRRFCALNCAAMPEDLIDAELFGHAKGAFTGAAVERLGLFESADGGTVFLDEVGELSARAQAKLLRVLQEGEIRRIGENFTTAFRRAPRRRHESAVRRRSRGAAVPAGFAVSSRRHSNRMCLHCAIVSRTFRCWPLASGSNPRERIASKAVLGHGALAALARYDWPGNVRELQNVLAGACRRCAEARGRGRVAAAAAASTAAQPAAHESLETARIEFEERFVRAALARAAGHRGRAAAALG